MTFRARQPGCACCEDPCLITSETFSEASAVTRFTTDPDGSLTVADGIATITAASVRAILDHDHPDAPYPTWLRIRFRGTDGAVLRFLVAWDPATNTGDTVEITVDATCSTIKIVGDTADPLAIPFLKPGSWYDLHACWDPDTGKVQARILQGKTPYEGITQGSTVTWINEALTGRRVGIGTGTTHTGIADFDDLFFSRLWYLADGSGYEEDKIKCGDCDDPDCLVLKDTFDREVIGCVWDVTGSHTLAEGILSGTALTLSGKFVHRDGIKIKTRLKGAQDSVFDIVVRNEAASTISTKITLSGDCSALNINGEYDVPLHKLVIDEWFDVEVCYADGKLIAVVSQQTRRGWTVHPIEFVSDRIYSDIIIAGSGEIDHIQTWEHKSEERENCPECYPGDDPCLLSTYGTTELSTALPTCLWDASGTWTVAGNNISVSGTATAITRTATPSVGESQHVQVSFKLVDGPELEVPDAAIRIILNHNVGGFDFVEVRYDAATEKVRLRIADRNGQLGAHQEILFGMNTLYTMTACRTPGSISVSLKHYNQQSEEVVYSLLRATDVSLDGDKVGVHFESGSYTIETTDFQYSRHAMDDPECPRCVTAIPGECVNCEDGLIPSVLKVNWPQMVLGNDAYTRAMAGIPNEWESGPCIHREPNRSVHEGPEILHCDRIGGTRLLDIPSFGCGWSNPSAFTNAIWCDPLGSISEWRHYVILHLVVQAREQSQWPLFGAVLPDNDYIMLAVIRTLTRVGPDGQWDDTVNPPEDEEPFPDNKKQNRAFHFFVKGYSEPPPCMLFLNEELPYAGSSIYGFHGPFSQDTSDAASLHADDYIERLHWPYICTPAPGSVVRVTAT